ncbi:MAG: MBL fold metallo-hydrolase [Dehalococcoidia bacterium]|nr:MBL fold metallo-hydrolase [Dehalococcoidia bacterium]
MQVYKPAPDTDFFDISPPIYGFTRFISVYVLRGKKTALVDIGPMSSSPRLFDGLRQIGIAPGVVSYIFATHIHLDHNGGLGEAIRQMPNAVAVVHEKGKPHVVSPERLWESSKEVLGELAIQYGQPLPVPEDRIITAREGMQFDLGNMVIEAMLTPGHASHHLCFLDTGARRLFVGDSAGVYNRDIDLLRPDTASPFHLEQFLTTLDKMINIAPETLCFTHFGCAGDAVNRLREHKKRMALWGRIIAESLTSDVDWQVVWEQIKWKDKVMERIDRLPADIRERELYFIKTSIAGYISYFNKYGTAVLASPF